jgi:hypothetical protein
MSITIAERLHPFSHRPGVWVMIPKSRWGLQVFPTLLRFTSGRELIEVPLAIEGPLSQFTVQQDLEKGNIRVFSTTFEYFVEQKEEGIVLTGKRGLSSLHRIVVKESVLHEPAGERLSLGMHKSQDWEMVVRRGDLREIFPVWLKIAEWFPSEESKFPSAGNFRFLSHLPKKREEMAAHFLNFFRSGFSGIMFPRLNDDDHQGILPEEPRAENGSPYPLITEGAKLIRSLFIEESRDGLAILPVLPPEFHAGRFTQIRLAGGDLLDIEWSKHLLRRATLHCKTRRTLHLQLQKPLDSFRLSRTLKDRGVRHAATAPLELVPGETLFLDRFQK